MSNPLAEGLRKAKDFYNYPKLSNLTINVTYDEYNAMNNAVIHLNSLFKMIRIRYTGEIDLTNIYPSMHVSHSKGSIVLINFGKIELDQNILFKYQGNIKINRCAVYGWGQNLVLAKIQNENSTLIKDDSNTVNTYDDFFDKPYIERSLQVDSKKSHSIKKTDLKQSYLNMIRRAKKHGI